VIDYQEYMAKRPPTGGLFMSSHHDPSLQLQNRQVVMGKIMREWGTVSFKHEINACIPMLHVGNPLKFLDNCSSSMRYGK
jgi:hypothetical protein